MNEAIRLKNRETALAVFLLLIAVLISAASTGCGKRRTGGGNAGSDTSDIYTLEVIKDRKQKDLYLMTSESSPIPAAEREAFNGLKYYPPDKRFAFATVLERLPIPETIVMATSKDRPREMLHIGALPFVYEGALFRLQVYMPKDTSEERYWFVPFTDATTGRETYGSGRYIDIDKPTSDSTFLDFNFAYNPYCAYNPGYDCPIPPKENRLPFAVHAGEKILHAGH